MKIKGLVAGALIATVALATQGHAGTVPLKFSGAGLSGSGFLTFGPDPVLGDPSGALAITGITGTFSDSNVGISNATITGIIPIDPVSPPKGAPFPNSFSIFSVTNPPPMDVGISYDNLFYPGGSPDVCPGYPFSGGFLDIYGVLFTLNNGDTVDFFSNGNDPSLLGAIYGAVVIDSTSTVIDNVAGGVSASVPEPGSLLLLGSFLLGAAALRRR